MIPWIAPNLALAAVRTSCYVDGVRFTFLVIPVVLPLLALPACSSSSSDADAGSPDGATAGDTGSPQGDAAPKTDAAPTACTVPAECPASDVCCETIPLTGGSIPNCTTGTVSAVCAAPAACATALGTGCTGTQTVRLCTKNADCTEKGDNQCCTFGSDAGAQAFCANGLVAAFGGGKCM